MFTSNGPTLHTTCNEVHYNDVFIAAEGGILMSSVNFRYRPDLPLVLQDISVQIVGGTKVILILA